VATVQFEVVPQDEVPSGPFALLARGHVLVARPLRDDLPFELRKRKQDVQRQAAKGRVGVELLGYGNEADAALFEQPHHSGEVD